MMNYRVMTEEDSEAVASLYKESFSCPWSFAAVKNMFHVDGYYSLVAENEEKEIVGYVGMKSVFDEADITNVAVSPAMRRQGIAKELIDILLARADNMGICSIFLEVRASNIPAIRLYEQAGFEDCGRRKNYYDAPTEDAILMVWNKK